MLRLITSGRVRLALAAVALAAAVVAVARLWRRPADRRTGLPDDGSGTVLPARRSRGALSTGGAGGASPARGPGPGAGHAPRRPAAPVLGTPEDEGPGRYAAKPPSAFRPAAGRTSGRGPRGKATRGRLVRWGAVGIGLCLLLLGAQALQNVVSSNGTETVEATGLRNRPGADERCELPEPGGPGDSVARHTGEEEQARNLIAVVCRRGPCSGDSCREVPEGPTARELFEAAEPGPEPGRTAEAATGTPDADCRPRARVPRVRAIDPRVTRAVNHQWRRIERWLEANAPASRRTLGGPARARTIAVAEAQMGLRFPDDLRASLLRHDGASIVAGTWPFGFLGNSNRGVREIRDTWRRLCAMDAEVEGDGDTRREWWDGRMIPFGADGSGDHLVIDSVVRDVGETDHEGMMSFTPGGTRIGSYHRLLRATADALETGGSVGYWRPVAADGELDWTIVRR
ncbi:SMI1/KNR4 family protein [Streptosporangium sp. NPDC048865]|uniref:SMI1/KNR4 family protein n=1 Tax=Streptosporangium sp. NPDC048865 TaxID=3155766 RepID=UPI003440AC2C